MKVFPGLRACLTMEEPDSLTKPVLSWLSLQKQTGRQRQTDRQKDRQTDRQENRQENRQTETRFKNNKIL